MTAAAPFSISLPMKSCASNRSPLIGRNSASGGICRESVVTAVRAASPFASPCVHFAACANVNRSMPFPPIIIKSRRCLQRLTLRQVFLSENRVFVPVRRRPCACTWYSIRNCLQFHKNREHVSRSAATQPRKDSARFLFPDPAALGRSAAAKPRKDSAERHSGFGERFP